jgi:hypothetical protein
MMLTMEVSADTDKLTTNTSTPGGRQGTLGAAQLGGHMHPKSLIRPSQQLGSIGMDWQLPTCQHLKKLSVTKGIAVHLSGRLL